MVAHPVLRATQFFEFIERLADSSIDGETVRLAPVFVQPESADDVAAAPAISRTRDARGSVPDPRRTASSDLAATSGRAALADDSGQKETLQRILRTLPAEWQRRYHLAHIG